MALYKRGEVWWYKFSWSGESVRESTKQTNKRVAQQIEAARKTQLAKGEVGIRDKKPIPTLEQFIEQEFMPFVRSEKAAKPNTVRFYANSAANLTAYSKMARLPLDRITTVDITGFAEQRRATGIQISTLNRDLSTLRRVFSLVQEWKRPDGNNESDSSWTLTTILPKVRMHPGENQRERVLTYEEEENYLEAAACIGETTLQDYEMALSGIRAAQRGQQPIKPTDPFLLQDVVTVLLDCGLRPEECYRLTWENIRDGAIQIFKGKRKASRRRVPASARVLFLLERRKTSSTSEWIFPAATKSGHIEDSTLKKKHVEALKGSEVSPFVIYDLRHTCLTRWAKTMDPFTLMKLAGHADLNTTRRYVHLNDGDVLAAMEKAAKARGGHNIGHTAENAKKEGPHKSASIN